MTTDPARHLTLKRLQLWLWAVGYFAGVAALCLGLMGLGCWLLASSAATDGSGVPAVALALAGVAFLLFLQPAAVGVPSPDGFFVDEDAEPRLFAAVRRAAALVGARGAFEVVITPGSAIACQEVGSLVGKGRRCRVEVGVAILQAVDTAQLEAQLALHLAHQADGDLRIRRVVWRTAATLEARIEGSSAGLSRPFRWYRSKLVDAFRAWDAAHVHAADAAAARAVGPGLFRASLRRATIVPGIFEQFLAEEVQPVLDEGYRPADLYGGFRQCLRVLDEVGELKRLEDEDAADTSTDGFPALGARLAALDGDALQVHPLPEPGGAAPARTLLAEPKATETRCAELRAPPRPDDAEDKGALGWDEVADRVWAPRFARAVAAVKGALPPRTPLSFVIEWLAVPSSLALAAAAFPTLLEPGVEAAERETRARRLLARAVAGWIGEELVARGWRWITSPACPVELESPTGSRFAPLAWVGAAVGQPDGVTQLREQLEELHLLEPDAQRPAQRTRSYLH